MPIGSPDASPIGLLFGGGPIGHDLSLPAVLWRPRSHLDTMQIVHPRCNHLWLLKFGIFNVPIFVSSFPSTTGMSCKRPANASQNGANMAFCGQSLKGTPASRQTRPVFGPARRLELQPPVCHQQVWRPPPCALEPGRSKTRRIGYAQAGLPAPAFPGPLAHTQPMSLVSVYGSFSDTASFEYGTQPSHG